MSVKSILYLELIFVRHTAPFNLLLSKFIYSLPYSIHRKIKITVGVSMPATVGGRNLLKTSTNRVRTSDALKGSDMWESVIGVKNEERGTNAGVEALLNAPGGFARGAQAKRNRQVAAAEAMKATGNFDTDVSDYNSLLKLAKEQGALGDNERRGACKICGQVGHLTKQCRNQFSKFFNEDQRAAIVEKKIEEPTASGSVDSLLDSLSDDSEDSGEKRRYREKRRREKRRSHHRRSHRDESRKDRSRHKEKRRRRDRSRERCKRD